MGERRTTAGNNGDRLFVRFAGRSSYSLLTSDGETGAVEFESPHLHHLGCIGRGLRGRPPGRPQRPAGRRCLVRPADEDGAPDPEKVKAAVSELLARKPHYAKRISGDVGQGARAGPADPNGELWGLIQARTR